jgi:SAM-dependent methyltransferase
MTKYQGSICHQTWSDSAISYTWNVASTLANRLKADLVLKYVSGHSRVCDIGCANGLFLRVLAGKCRKIIGADLISEMLNEARGMIARDRIENASLVQCNASNLPFADASFDVAYCFSTLVVVPDADGALQHMARILRPGGVLIIDVPGRNNIGSLYWNLWYRRRGHFGTQRFSFPAIRKALEGLGFEIVEAHALGFCDQWKYMPGLHWAKWLDKVFQASPEPDRNLDYRISNRAGVFRCAARWYIVARKA